MKKFIYLFICICLLLGTAACGKKDQKKPVDLSNMKVDEKYYPEFMDSTEGKESLKSLVFGSMGWSLYSSDNFLFALVGRYIVRYNINENNVDQIIQRGADEWPSITSFSKDGRYVITGNFDFNGTTSRNYFLMDLEKQTVNLICDVYDEEKIDEIINQKIPDEIKKDINSNLTFNHNSFNESSTLEFNSSLEKPYKTIVIFHDEQGNTKELTSLEGYSTCGAYNIFDKEKIGVVMPVEPMSCDIGNYKIAIVDVKQDKIIQEYILNKK